MTSEHQPITFIIFLVLITYDVLCRFLAVFYATVGTYCVGAYSFWFEKFGTPIPLFFMLYLIFVLCIAFSLLNLWELRRNGLRWLSADMICASLVLFASIFSAFGFYDINKHDRDSILTAQTEHEATFNASTRSAQYTQCAPSFRI